MGPGGERGHGRRRQAGVLRLLPRGVRPRPVRDLHRPAHRRRPAHRARHGHLPVRPPAAGQRRAAAQLAGQRQGGAGHRRRPARRVGVPDPDGLPGRARRRRRTLWSQHIERAADFLVAHGPSFGVERWEEQSGYSPSTIAAEIAGLTAASAIATMHHDTARAQLYQATADDFQRNIKNWTVTTTGPDAPRYFIRLSKTGDPNAAITYSLGNGGPTVDQRQVIDGGFQELVRLGELPANDPDIQASLVRAGQADLGAHAQRHRLLPLRQLGRRGQRGRLRRLLPAQPDLLHRPGSALADHRRRHRAPVAGPLRRTRRIRPRPPATAPAPTPCSTR